MSAPRGADFERVRKGGPAPQAGRAEAAPPDRPFLAIESSTSRGSVAVGDARGVRAEMVLDVVGAHSSALLPAVDQVMRAAGLRPAELGAVVVGAGPGSFTGLRIAAATAKGIVHALGLPLFAYSSLLVAATAAWGGERPVCALFDARKRDVFAGCWAFPAGGDGASSAAIEVLMEPTALSLDELVAGLRGGPSPVFVGDGALLHEEELRRELDARVMPAALGGPRAASLLWLARIDPGSGAVEDPGAWEPDYVRDPGAVRIAAARAAGGAG
jgi:tRNA threonylcarbamoyladenosine biosynthesis protein TsaB